MPAQDDILNLSPRTVDGSPAGYGRMDPERRDKVQTLLQQAKKWWDERADFRRRRAEVRDYEKGDQWQQMTEDEDGNQITEEEKIKNQGRIPWVINQISKVKDNLKGQFRQNTSERAVFAVDREDSKATEMMNVKRRGTRRWNRASVVEADQFAEHIRSGASGFKVTIDWQGDLDRNEVEIDPIDQTRLFYNLDLEDRRMKNLRLIGELHDLPPEELLATYAVDADGNFSREKAERLKTIYGDLDRRELANLSDVGFDATDSLDFYAPPDAGLARVIEMWVRRHKLTRYAHDRERGTYTEIADDVPPDAVERLNAQRRDAGQAPVEVQTKVEEAWIVYHMSPRGDILYEQESPYWHERHPYVLALATLVDGETWGLLEQVIDPQRWLNRLVTMIDHGLGTGAKGVLLVPEQTIPDELTIDNFAEEWSRQGGVLKIRMKPGVEPPQEITSNSIKPGSFELLTQLKQWIEETSGVTGAQMGEEPPSGTPAALFQQQIIQSSLSNLDYFESFFEGVRTLDYKCVQCLQQAIDKPIQMSEGATQQPVEYRPDDVRNLRFDVSVGSVRDTATFRQIFEEDLRTFLEAGFINFGTYLQLSAHPKADTLLRVLQQRDPSILEMGTTEMQAATAALTGEDPLAGQQTASPGDGQMQQQPPSVSPTQ